MGTRFIDSQRLREVLRYEMETGNFVWVSRTAARTKEGGIAGTFGKDGYVRIQIDGCIYKAHRLAFVYVTGKCDCEEVDHINGNRADNRWCNLRAANKSTNMQNKRNPQKNNTTGFLGVSFDRSRNKYIASIGVNGRKLRIGRFNDPASANAAYLAAKAEFHCAGHIT